MTGRGRKAQGPSVYMHAIELSQLFAVVEAVAPRRCLEWGSGGSTRALLEACPFIERYVSVEHDPTWHAEVTASVTDPRLSYHLVPPDVPHPDRKDRRAVIAWEARAEEQPEMFASYVGLPRTLGLRFDFVLVDGRARGFCLEEGWQLLDPGGVILLHDAQREQYQPTLRALGRAVFLEPWKQGQIAFVRKP